MDRNRLASRDCRRHRRVLAEPGRPSAAGGVCVGRLVVRTLAFFWATALVAIALGFLIGALIVPQAAVTPEQQVALRAAAGADVGAIQRAAESLPGGAQFIAQLVPANPFKAAA